MGNTFSCCVSKRSCKVKPISIRNEASGQADRTSKRDDTPSTESSRSLAARFNVDMFLAKTLLPENNQEGMEGFDGMRPRNPSPPKIAVTSIKEIVENCQSFGRSSEDLIESNVAANETEGCLAMQEKVTLLLLLLTHSLLLPYNDV